jgi:hypothetical protein
MWESDALAAEAFQAEPAPAAPAPAVNGKSAGQRYWEGVCMKASTGFHSAKDWDALSPRRQAFLEREAQAAIVALKDAPETPIPDTLGLQDLGQVVEYSLDRDSGRYNPKPVRLVPGTSWISDKAHEQIRKGHATIHLVLRPNQDAIRARISELDAERDALLRRLPR